MAFEKGNKLGHRFTSTDQPPGYLKKPKLARLPKNARRKVEAALYHVLTLKDKSEAEAYIRRTSDELPEFGFIIQVYAKSMMGRHGDETIERILNRLFGKPKQVSTVSVDGPVGVQVSVGSQAAEEGLRVALENGGVPRPADDGEDE